MASKGSVVGIVAWVLVVVLAIGAGALGFLFQKQSARATGLQNALAQVVATAGDAPLMIGQRVLVKFMKPGETAGAKRAVAAGVGPNQAMKTK